jgi:hypothetical protein
MEMRIFARGESQPMGDCIMEISDIHGQNWPISMMEIFRTNDPKKDLRLCSNALTAKA